MIGHEDGLAVQAILPLDPDAGEAGGLAHGPTFMGNPLMCAVASASLDLLTDPRDGWAAQVPRVEAGLRAGLAAAFADGLRSVAIVLVHGQGRRPVSGAPE